MMHVFFKDLKLFLIDTNFTLFRDSTIIVNEFNEEWVAS
jgi:hypothetical protein